MLSKKNLKLLLPIFVFAVFLYFVTANLLSKSTKQNLTPPNKPTPMPVAAQLNQAGTIKIVSFNVLDVNHQFCNSEPEMSAVVSYLIQNEIDVMVIQEHNQQCGHNKFADRWQAALISQGKSDRVKYTQDTKGGSGSGIREVGIWTRLPVENAITSGDPNNPSIPLQVDDGSYTYSFSEKDGNDSCNPGNARTRTIRNFVVNVGGVKIRIIGIHPTNCESCNQLNGVIKDYLNPYLDPNSASSMPVIIAGDYNCSARSFYQNFDVNTHQPSMWFLQNFNVTCLNPSNPGDFPSNPLCGRPGAQFEIEDNGNPDEAQGPVDHIGVLRSEINNVLLEGPSDYKILREPTDLLFSDHNPIKAEVKVLTRNAVVPPTNTPTPDPNAPPATATSTPVPAAPPPGATSTPTPVATVAASTSTSPKLRADISEMSGGSRDIFEELVYYAIFSIGYLTLIRFGFNIHRFFSFVLLTIIFLLGLGVTAIVGLPGGLFVVIMGTFMIMMM